MWTLDLSLAPKTCSERILLHFALWQPRIHCLNNLSTPVVSILEEEALVIECIEESNQEEQLVDDSDEEIVNESTADDLVMPESADESTCQ